MSRIEQAREKVRKLGLEGDAGNLAYCGALEAELTDAEAELTELLDLLEVFRGRRVMEAAAIYRADEILDARRP